MQQTQIQGEVTKWDANILIAKKKFDENIKLEGNDWNLYEDKNGYMIHTKPDKETGHTLSRGAGVVSYSIEEFFAVLDDVTNRAEYDEMFEKGHDVEVLIPGTSKIIYQKFKGQMLVSSRDFVLVVRKFINEDGSWTIIATSCDYTYPEAKSTVRGNLITAGWYLKPENDGKQLRIIYLTLLDPKGMVPKKLVSMTAFIQGRCVQRVKEYLDKKNNKK